MLSFYSDSMKLPYVAELFHIISLVVSTGPTFIRSSVHELVVNAIHSLVTNKNISIGNRKKLKYVLDDVCDGKYRVHFGLSKSYANAFTITEDTMTDNVEHMNLASLEVIVRLLLDATNYAAPNIGKVTVNNQIKNLFTHNIYLYIYNIDTANTWHARWMSLVTSMTFQFNPALQPRSFVILGCLAQEEIDDDLLFQILIVLRNELGRFDDNNPYLVISILMCLTNIIDNLSLHSRYLKSLFWLAIAMIQMNHNSIFSYAVKLLHGVLRTLDSHKCFDTRSVEDTLMEARTPFRDVSQEIDAASGLSFTTQFSFAIAGVLLKGFGHSDARDTVFACLTTFIEIETKSSLKPNMIDANCLGYLCALLPFAAKNDALTELLRLAGVNDIDVEEIGAPFNVYSMIWRAIDIPNNTTGILLVSFLVGMLNLAENEAERLFLYGFLSRAAISTPEVFALV
jgi:neurofibromin 1